MTRDRDPLQSNDFAFSRWLVPYLCGYDGAALFIDCDMMFRSDIKELFDLFDPRYAVQVVKHNHVPEETVKYLGTIQTRYHRKNWSSVMLFNCAKCDALTPEYVNSAHGLDLHQFRWLEDDLIGELPQEWNHLVGYNSPNPAAKNVHWTIGGPYFDEFRDAEFAEEWFAERRDMEHCSQIHQVAASAHRSEVAETIR